MAVLVSVLENDGLPEPLRKELQAACVAIKQRREEISQKWLKRWEPLHNLEDY